MKKLMIALTAVATAFGLYAADNGLISGAGFDSGDADAKYSWKADGGFVEGFWVNKNAATRIEDDCGWTGGRPAAFEEGDHDGALKIATTLGTPVKQLIKTSGTQAIDAGLYFDGLVNFTVFDKDDTPAAADAKLAVYLQLEGDDESKTNFIVRAAGPNNTTNDYRCVGGGKNLAPGWHRLTIKMIDSICTDSDLVGFVVYVDGVAVNNADAKPQDGLNLKPAARIFNDAGELFASLEGGADEISYVAFDGQGVVDDIAFTTTAPTFAADPQAATVGWDTTKVASISLTEDGDPLPSTPNPAVINMSDLTGGKVYYKAKDGFVDGYITVTDGDNKTIGDDEPITAAAASFAGKGYAALKDAVDAANAAEATGELKLYAAATAIQIDNANGVAVTLDLNGFGVNGIQLKSNVLTINNTGAAATVMGVTSLANTTLTLNGGNFFGVVSVQGTLVIPSDSTAEFFDPVSDQDASLAIATVAALNKLALVVKAGYATAGKTFKQTADIDFEGATFAGIGMQYKENLTAAGSFAGVYDGNNKSITNIKFGAKQTYQGLFNGVVGTAANPAAVKNLTVEVDGFDLTDAITDYGAAAIVGTVWGDVTIENCTAQGSLTAHHNVGGIACKSHTVSADVPKFIACTNEMTIVNNLQENPKAAGIITLSEGASLTDCCNKGSITVTYKNVTDAAGGAAAGLIAYCQNAATTITGGGNEGTVAGGLQDSTGSYPTYVGQLVGRANASTTTIADGVKVLDSQLAVGSAAAAAQFVGARFAADGVTATPAIGGTYAVVAPFAAATLQLGENDTVSFNVALATFDDTGITAKDDLELVKDTTTTANVWAYSTKTPAPTGFSITITWSDAPLDNPFKSVSATVNGEPVQDLVSGTPFMVAADAVLVINAELIDWNKLVGGTAVGGDTITENKAYNLTTQVITPDPDKVTAADVGITSGAFLNESSAKIAKVVTWAEAQHITTEAVNAMAFVDPLTDTEKAYLFNCSLSQVEEKEAAFKFPSITPGQLPQIGGTEGVNGDVKTWGANAVTGPWTETTEAGSYNFYKATLSK